MDEKGDAITKGQFTLLATYIALKSGICKNVIVPNTATRKIEILAKQHGAQVRRTKSSVIDTLNELLDSSAPDDEHMFQFQLYFDVIASLGRIISFLVKERSTLNGIMKELPDIHMKKIELPCDFEDRGRVVSEFIKQNENKGIELFEGIKINYNDGWSLVLPDSDKPVFNIFSEGYNEEYAEELSAVITENVKEIIMAKNIE